MTLRSLRLRLFAFGALIIALALVVAGIAIGLIFVSSAERGVRSDLTDSLGRLIARVEPASVVPLPADPLPDPRYSTPLGGAYWQVTDSATGNIWRSPSLLDDVLALDPPLADEGRPSLRTLSGPNGLALLSVARDVRFGARRLAIIIAEDRVQLDESIRRFSADLAVALTILGVALMVAFSLQVHLGLLPLRAIRAGVADVRQGKLSALPANYPAEVQPLVSEVNELLAAQAASIEFARTRAADLAHGLRTPLTVLRTIAPRLRDRADEEGATLVERMVDSMDDRIAYQLRLARLRHRTRSHELRSSLNEVVEGTIDVLVRTPAGEALRWETDLLPGLMVNMDRQDLRELVGILLENATKWAATSVTITAQREISNKITLRILDDGPGVPPGYEALLGKRGQRLDETTEGSGLGLAIAKEILAINNGSVDFALGPQGGLLVQLHLPAAHG